VPLVSGALPAEQDVADKPRRGASAS
jgi:hypothetical protein